MERDRPRALHDNFWISSGVVARRELLKMLDALAPGDVVTVTLIDRLARSTFDLFAIVKQIVDAKSPVPFSGRAVGRHRHQHRTVDDCRCWADWRTWSAI